MTSNLSNHTEKLREINKRHVWHHLTPGSAAVEGLPTFVKGEGLNLWDDAGNEYLDASAGGVWVTNVGYGRTEIAKAIYDQLSELNFFASATSNQPAARFAERLLEKMPGMNRVFYSSSGSEANEKAFKMVRQIAHKKYGGKKHKILYRERDYHGTTLAALSATGQAERRAQFGPFVPGFVEIPHCCEYRSQFGDVGDYGVLAAMEMEKVILREGPDTVGAVILEPITAGGGVILPPHSYFETIQMLCKKYDILLHIDEVVCGLGRTGAWFGYQHYGIKPDIVTMAKGLASGYAAVSCTVTTETIYQLLQEDENDPLGYFRDISTYGGCLAGPTAAMANLEIVERENLVENSAHQGECLLAGLQALKEKYTIIGDVRGKGLFCGIELVKDHITKAPVDESIAIALVNRCKELGLLIGRTNRSFNGFNNIVNLSPALTISSEQVCQIIDTLDKALKDIQKL